PGLFGRIEDQLAAGEPLSEVVVGIPLQFQGQAAWNEGTETLTGGSGKTKVDGVLRQAVPAVSPGDLTSYDGSGHTVDVSDRKPCPNRFSLGKCGLAQIKQHLQ